MNFYFAWKVFQKKSAYVDGIKSWKKLVYELEKIILHLSFNIFNTNFHLS